MICVHVFAKRLSIFFGEKEHGVERDLLDHYKEKGGYRIRYFLVMPFLNGTVRRFFFVKFS